jgi:uncharacterized caspase-like protein
MRKSLLLTGVCLLIVSIASSSQTNSITNSLQEKRIALVIGNGNYNSDTLANAENDAKDMKVALQGIGFTVIEYENLSQIQMKKAIDDFVVKLKGNDVGLFYYSGQGILAKGNNCLIPVDVRIQSEQRVENDCVQAEKIISLMATSGSKINIMIIEAGRNNPFEKSWTRTGNGNGLAFFNGPPGTFIAYATVPGKSISSEGTGKNSLYTSAILENIKTPDLEINQMFDKVRKIVSQKSNNQQVPWESSSLTKGFYFNRGTNVDYKNQCP